MVDSEGATPSASHWFAIPMLAIAGLAFAWTPLADRLDDALLDVEFAYLRKFDPRPAIDEIVVVGVDETSLRAIAEPPELWHEPLGAVLAKIAGARPRAIAINLALPDRSYERVRPGIERALLEGIEAARRATTLVAALSIDARTRSARPIDARIFALLGEQRVGINMLPRDGDGITRRFSLAIPTEDGSFPTLAGRLCRALSKHCDDGLIDFARGAPFSYVPFHRVLQASDPEFLEKLFRNRIVVLGEVLRFSDRVAVPVNLAGWESGGSTSPSIVVHAQALRTALYGDAPREVGRPVIVVLVTIAALLFVMRDWRLAFVAALLAAAAAAGLATYALRSGHHVRLAPVIVVLALAWALRAALGAWGKRRAREGLRLSFAGHASPSVLKDVLRGAGAPPGQGARRELAFISARIEQAPPTAAQSVPQAALALLSRVHTAIASAIHRNQGYIECVRGDGVSAVFGAPRPLEEPCRAAWAAVAEMHQGLERLNAELSNSGAQPLSITVGLACGEALVGLVHGRERSHYVAAGDAARLADDFQREASKRGLRAVVSGAAHARLAEARLEALDPLAMDGGSPVEVWGLRGGETPLVE